MPPQQMQFIHYQPNADPRHNGMYTPPPQDYQHGMPVQMHGYAQVQAPCYPQQMWQHPAMYNPRGGHFANHRVMTPVASPPPMGVAPRIIVEPQLDTSFIVESRHSPSPPTPSLSACPSTVSSPPASSVYQTPVCGGGYFSFAIDPKDDSNVMSFLEHEWSETSRKY